MSLKHAVEKQLAALALPLVGPVVVQASDAREQAELELAELDRLGASVARLVVSSTCLAGVELERLRALGEQLARQLTYLLEPLRVIECDGESCAVQMRSSQPHREGDDRFFYELWLRRGGQMELVRWHTVPGAVKEQVPMQLTREILLRLVDDLQQAAWDLREAEKI